MLLGSDTLSNTARSLPDTDFIETSGDTVPRKLQKNSWFFTYHAVACICADIVIFSKRHGSISDISLLAFVCWYLTFECVFFDI